MVRLDTDVIVVGRLYSACPINVLELLGNGPAGIALSTFLSGWHPIYDLNHPHPDKILHEHLSPTASPSLLLDSVNENTFPLLTLIKPFRDLMSGAQTNM